MYFLSCEAELSDLRDLLKQENGAVNGLYRVIGSDPWLMLCDTVERFSSPPDLRKIRISTAIKATERSNPDTEGSAPQDSVHSFIFMRPFIGPKVNPRLTRNWILTLEDIPRIAEHTYIGRFWSLEFSEWWFAAEIFSKDLHFLGKCLEELSDMHIDTHTSVVLLSWCHNRSHDVLRENNRNRAAYFDFAPEADPLLKVASIIRNDRHFFSHSQTEQCSLLFDNLNAGVPISSAKRSTRPSSEEDVQDMLTYEIERGVVDAHPLELARHNPYFERFSVRPIAVDWYLDFVFIRAAQHYMVNIRDRIRNLVGTRINSIVPRAYQITGEYDYLIPVYWASKTARKEIDNLLMDLPIDGAPRVISAVIPDAYGEKGHSRQRSDAMYLMTDVVVRNGGCLDEFWSELEQAIESSSRKDEAEWYSVSPRVGLLLGSGVGSRRERSQLPKGLQDLGMAVTWEMETHPGGTAFIQLTAKTPTYLETPLRNVKQSRGQEEKRNELRAAIDRSKERHEIAFDYFLAGEREIVGIARFHVLEELERFLHRVRKHCERKEIHLILKQLGGGFDLNNGDKCAPCIWPERENGAPRTQLGCHRCKRYIAAPLVEVTPVRLVVDVGEAQAAPFRCGVVEFQMTPEDLVSIGAVPQLTEWASDFDRSVNAAWRQSRMHVPMADEVFKMLVEGDCKHCDVVLFPEYSIPLLTERLLIRALETHPHNKRRFLVLGSHLDERGYNVSPIVVIDPATGTRVFYQQKGIPVGPEKKGLVKRNATGTYFFRTWFGNIRVALCRDAHNVRSDQMENVDLLLVPSWHKGKATSLPKLLENLAVPLSHVVAFANGAPHQAESPAISRIVVATNTKPTMVLDTRRTLGGFVYSMCHAEISIKALDERRKSPAAPSGVHAPKRKLQD